MTRIVIKKLVWDDWNRKHIEKHGVSQEEIEIAGNKSIYHKRTYKERYLVIGRSGRRLITIVLKRIDSDTYYLITARDASKKERKIAYEKEKKQNSRI